MVFPRISFRKKHIVNSTKYHDPVPGGLENELVTLDANGLPAKNSGVQIGDIVGGLIPQGDWAASTNTPTLVNGTGTPGHFYRASDAGTVDFGAGNITFAAGDYVLYTSGNVWIKQDNTQDIHAIGGAMHSQSTLNELGAKISNLNNSQVITTGGAGSLSQETKNSAFNKIFGSVVGHVPEIGIDLGSDEIMETNATHRLITAAKNTAYNKDFGDSSGTILEGDKISSTYQASGLHVSDSKGNDSNDGSLFRPFKTINAAISFGATRGDNVVQIILDTNSGSYTAILPDSQDVSISSPQGMIATTPGNITSITVGSGLSLFLNNVNALLIKEAASMINSTIYVEECLVRSIKDNAGTGFATNLSGVFTNVLCELTCEIDIAGMGSSKGNGIDWETGKPLMFKDIDMRGHKVTAMADGSANDDGATFGQLSGLVSLANQFPTYYVSDSMGSDSNDGGMFSPVKTIQKAIDLAALVESIIILDLTGYPSYAPATIAANSSITIMSLETYSPNMGGITLTVNDNAWLQLKNLWITLVKEGSGITNTYVVSQDCHISHIRANDGVSAPAKTYGYFNNTETSYADVLGMLGYYGVIKDTDDVEKLIPLTGLKLNTNQIEDVGDPIANQDADTKAARDSAITTHSGISDAHHVKTTELDDEYINIDKIGTPTYSTLEDLINIFQSAGIVDGGDITDAGSNSINVTGVKVLIKATDNEIGQNLFVDVAGLTGAAMTINVDNYVYVDYNGGTPIMAISPSVNPANGHTIFNVGKVFREDSVLHIMPGGQRIPDLMRRVQEYLGTKYSQQRIDGMWLSEVGTRNIIVSDGSINHGLNDFPFAEVNTSTTGLFNSWYKLNGVWTKISAQTQIDNLQYNDISTPGSEVLANIGVSKYGVFWVYAEADGDVDVVYGIGSYSLSEAQLTSPPAVPPLLPAHAVIIGRIIIGQNGSSFAEVASAFSTVFQPTQVTDHNDTANKDGGAIDEFYHMTLAEHTEATRDFGGAATPGIVPDPVTETGKFLKDDGSWDTPSGGGFTPMVIGGAGFQTSGGTYGIYNRFPFLGTTKLGTPTKIKVITRVSNSGSVRVYDLTNSQVIVEKTGIVNTGYESIDLGTLANLPAGEAVLELQYKNDGAGADWIIVYGASIE